MADTPAPVAVAGVSPTIVGLLRGLVYALVIALGSAVVAFTGGLSADDLGEYAWALPVFLAAARALEGYIDKVRGQAPQVPAGSKPADPAAYAPTATAILEVAPDPAARAAAIEEAIKAAMPRAAGTTVDRVTEAVLAVK